MCPCSRLRGASQKKRRRRGGRVAIERNLGGRFAGKTQEARGARGSRTKPRGALRRKNAGGEGGAWQSSRDTPCAWQAHLRCGRLPAAGRGRRNNSSQRPENIGLGRLAGRTGRGAEGGVATTPRKRARDACAGRKRDAGSPRAVTGARRPPHAFARAPSGARGSRLHCAPRRAGSPRRAAGVATASRRKK